MTTNGNLAVTAKFVLRRCVVPNVVGKRLTAAKTAIKKAYCSVGTVTTVSSAKPKGQVVAQKPKHASS